MMFAPPESYKQPSGQRHCRYLHGHQDLRSSPLCIGRGKRDYDLFGIGLEGCTAKEAAAFPAHIPILGLTKEEPFARVLSRQGTSTSFCSRLGETSEPVFPAYMPSFSNAEKIAIAAYLVRPATTNEGRINACSLRSVEPCQSLNRVENNGIPQNLYLQGLPESSSNSVNPVLLNSSAIVSASYSNIFSLMQTNNHVEATWTSSLNPEQCRLPLAIPSSKSKRAVSGESMMRPIVQFSTKKDTSLLLSVSSPPATPSQSQYSSTESSVGQLSSLCDSVSAQKERATLSQRRLESLPTCPNDTAALKFAFGDCNIKKPHFGIDQTSAVRDLASRNKLKFTSVSGNDASEIGDCDQIRVAETNVAGLPQMSAQSISAGEVLNDQESSDTQAFVVPTIECRSSGFSFQRLINGDPSMLDYNCMDDDDDDEDDEESSRMYLEYFSKLKADEDKKLEQLQRVAQEQQQVEVHEESKDSINSADSNTFGKSSEHVAECDEMYQSFGNSHSNIPVCERSSTGEQSLLPNRNSRPSVSGRTLCSVSPKSDTYRNMCSEVSQDFQSSSKRKKTSSNMKPEAKVSKQIASKQAPGTAKALLATGLLEGQHVRYIGRGGQVFLTGVICNSGILCNCPICKGKNVVNVSGFEKHAGSTARHPSDFIFLDSGKTLHDILEIGWHAPEGEIVEAILGVVNGHGENEGRKRCSLCGNSMASALCVKENCTYASHPACVSAIQQSLASSLCSKCVTDEVQQNKSEITSIRTEESIHSSNIENSSVSSLASQVSLSEKFINRIEQAKPSNRADNSSIRFGQTIRLNQTRHMSLHKLIFLPGSLPDGTELAYHVKGQQILKGIKQGTGIQCNCCNQVVSCSQFEAHAGWGSRRNPYNSIFVSDGRSLHDVAVEISLQKQEQTQNSLPSTGNNDVCSFCGDRGNLLRCDGCPQAYHKDCSGFSKELDGDWFCPNCRGARRRLLGKQVGKGFSKIMKDTFQGRCHRVVKASENSGGGCVICRNGDFLKSGFGDRTIILCDQCEREYHVSCLKEKGLADLKELPSGEWFCAEDCNRIHATLQCLVKHGAVSVDSQISKSVLEQQQEKLCNEQTASGSPNFMWQLLNHRCSNPNDAQTLTEAETIFAESFDPITDTSSGRDLIPLMVYSESIRDEDFGGMYCAVLKWNGRVVCAVIFRVFGRQFAEMPLVATSSAFRGQGFFQILHSCLECVLGFLQVENLILPAAEGTEGIWINKYGFSKMHHDQLWQLKSEVQIMIFQGSIMLLKHICPIQKLHGSSESGTIDKEESVTVEGTLFDIQDGVPSYSCNVKPLPRVVPHPWFCLNHNDSKPLIQGL